MCATCGCSDDSKTRLIDMQSGEEFDLAADHQVKHDRTS